MVNRKTRSRANCTLISICLAFLIGWKSRKIGSMTNQSDPQRPDRSLYIIMSRLFGTHSIERRAAAMDWYSSATLHSVLGSLRNLLTNEPDFCKNGKYFIIVLVTGGTYENHTISLHLQQQIQKFNCVAFETFSEGNEYQLAKRLTGYDVVHITRLDADDMLQTYFLSKLGRITSQLPSKHIHVVGSNFIHQILLQKFNNNLQCLHNEIRYHAGYLFSTGLTVSMQVSTWFSNFKTWSFGDHTRILENLKKNAPHHTICSSYLPHPGFYMVTQLSGHFPSQEKIPNCNLTSLKLLVNDSPAVEILENIAVPLLSIEAQMENAFIENTTA